ncbi:unnamed protein product, partial [Amoebophrya sp. A25]|eukprot:GSA25T00006687001.1
MGVIENAPKSVQRRHGWPTRWHPGKQTLSPSSSSSSSSSSAAKNGNSYHKGKGKQAAQQPHKGDKSKGKKGRRKGKQEDGGAKGPPLKKA